MKNYLLSYHQFQSIIEGIETTSETGLSLRDSMLNIIKFLKEKGYSDESCVDMIIQLRHQDEFTIRFMKLYVGDNQELIDSINKILESVRLPNLP